MYQVLESKLIYIPNEPFTEKYYHYQHRAFFGPCHDYDSAGNSGYIRTRIFSITHISRGVSHHPDPVSWFGGVPFRIPDGTLWFPEGASVLFCRTYFIICLAIFFHHFHHGSHRTWISGACGRLISSASILAIYLPRA